MQNSLWLNGTELPKFDSLSYEIKTDVLVIGGGIAGILTAYFLKQKGADCILVEKNSILHGTTSGTTGKITYQHGFIYSDIASKEGFDCAKMYLKANMDAFDIYTKMCREIECDYEIKDNYVYSENNLRKIEKELKCLEKIGYNAKYSKDLPIPVKTVGAVKFEKQAQFHPIKFLKVIAENLKIYENTFVLEIDGKKVTTNKGTIKAEKVVVATHFPFIDLHGSYFIKLYQHRSYAVALDNGKEINGMYVSDNMSGLSFRNYKDLLILVGGSHRTGKYGGSYNEIESYSRIHYPNSRIKFKWAAQDCISLDKKPYIGRYSKNTPDMYVATGFNKWGMTGSMLSAMILSDMISGKNNEYSDVFSPSRSVIKPQVLINGFESVTNLLNPFGKRCPHLGCSLKWNKSERSWDCPCHGSRFTSDGKVINNPANGDLKG